MPCSKPLDTTTPKTARTGRIGRFSRTIATVTLIALCACSASFDPKRNAIQNTLRKADYHSLAQQYLNPKGNPNYNTDDLLEMLTAAKAFHDAGFWKLSSQAFRRAERKLLWKTDSVDTPTEFANIVAQTLVNDTVGPYHGHIFEGVLINYYQALNAIMLGNEDDARVALNRAEVRQDNAQIQLGNLQRISSQAGNEARAHIRNSFDPDSLNKTARNARYQALDSIDPGRQYRNNAVDTASLIFRMTSTAQSDASKVEQLTDTAHASALSASAHNAINSATRTGPKAKGQIFLIYEDGIGPSLAENRYDLWFNQHYYHSPSVAYAGIALPKFLPGETGPGSMTIQSDTNSVTTAPLTFIEQLAGREFASRFDGILARALVSSFLKVIGQSVVNNALTNNNENNQPENNAAAAFVSTLTGLFTQQVLTKADTRAWINLPNSIQIATIERPANGMIDLYTNRYQRPTRIVLPFENEHGNIIILARATQPSGKLTAYIKELPGAPYSKQS